MDVKGSREDSSEAVLPGRSPTQEGRLCDAQSRLFRCVCVHNASFVHEAIAHRGHLDI